MSKTSKINTASVDPIEVYTEYQSWKGGDNHTSNYIGKKSDTRSGWPARAGYSKDTMRKLLKDNPDYQHGPVKRSTPNEVD